MNKLQPFALAFTVVIAACATDDPAPPDDTGKVTVSGTAVEVSASGMTPLAGITVGAYRAADEATAVATATTDADGKYALKIPSNGAAVDGFLKATKDGYMVTYLYPP